jgi:biopolymer transport protein ExbD
MENAMRHLAILTLAVLAVPLALGFAEGPVALAADPAPTGTAAATGTQDVIIKTIPGVVVDTKAREVRLEARVCLTRGPLELLACGSGTKEHESIFSLKAQPSQVTYALFLLGLEPGVPGQALDRGIYRPPSGEILDVTVRFIMPNGETPTVPAWKLLRLAGSEAPVERPIGWVYVGVPSQASLRASDVEGTVICLSNFAAAVVDVPFESSSANTSLSYEINPGILPPVGTKAEIILHPVGRRTEPKKMVTEVIVRKGKPILLDGKEVDLETFRQTVTRMPADIRLALLKVDPAETWGRALELHKILAEDALMTVRMSAFEAGDRPDGTGGAAPLKVTVTADGHVQVGTEKWTIEEFRAKAAHAFQGARAVDVVADPKAPANVVNEVIGAARQAGAEATLVPGSAPAITPTPATKAP